MPLSALASRRKFYDRLPAIEPFLLVVFASGSNETAPGRTAGDKGAASAAVGS